MLVVKIVTVPFEDKLFVSCSGKGTGCFSLKRLGWSEKSLTGIE